MQVKFPRYRWWPLIACLVAVAIAVIGSCLRSDPAAQLMRERYERVRLGMTQAEVESVMGDRPQVLAGYPLQEFDADIDWVILAMDGQSRSHLDAGYHWINRAGAVSITYQDGSVVGKTLTRRVRRWRSRAAESFNWLRGLVGR
jgi:hypothetical protein